MGGAFPGNIEAPRAAGIAKLNATGVLDTVFNPAAGAGSSCADNAVYAVAINGGTLVIGGALLRTIEGAPARAGSRSSIRRAVRSIRLFSGLRSERL